jgi:hypothetical protein
MRFADRIGPDMGVLVMHRANAGAHVPMPCAGVHAHGLPLITKDTPGFSRTDLIQTGPQGPRIE